MDRITIRILLATLVLVGIGGYAFFEFGKLRHGPLVTIQTPLNGAVTSSPVADIKGVAKNIVKITMNDREISILPDGAFEEKFVLSQGSNKVKLSGVDRFGNTSESFVEILYTGPSQPLVQRNASMSEYQ